MPLTLALDCALRRINLGASDGGKFLGEFSADVGAKQSEILPAAVENFLSAFGRTVRDVSSIAVTAGPGYFTGIRVGLSYATGLAGSLGVMVTPVSTLGAMASCLLEALAASGAECAVVPVIPAGRGSFYAAAYRMETGGGQSTRIEASFLEAGVMRERIEALAERGGVIVTGYDFPRELENLSRLRFIPQLSVAAGIINLARSRRPIDPAAVRADYLRPHV
jgi:tRNA threonylcarbamoyladenosine biosynthesis protein TsaB